MTMTKAEKMLENLKKGYFTNSALKIPVYDGDGNPVTHWTFKRADMVKARERGENVLEVLYDDLERFLREGDFRL